MYWIILIAAGLFVFYKSGGLGSLANKMSEQTGDLNQLGSGSGIDTGSLIPFQTADGQSGFLESDGTVVDASGNTIGMANSSGPRPGESGGVDIFGDDDDEGDP